MFIRPGWIAALVISSIAFGSVGALALAHPTARDAAESPALYGP